MNKCLNAVIFWHAELKGLPLNIYVNISTQSRPKYGFLHVQRQIFDIEWSALPHPIQTYSISYRLILNRWEFLKYFNETGVVVCTSPGIHCRSSPSLISQVRLMVSNFAVNEWFYFERHNTYLTCYIFVRE